MIQRIQSVYILVAIVLQGLSLVLNWSTYIAGEQFFMFSGLSAAAPSLSALPLTIGIIASMVTLLVILFMFNNRTQQMKLANIAMLELVATLGLFSWVHYQTIESLKSDHGTIEIGYGIAVIFPIISAILLWLAKKAIKKDEDLVKSVDRLR